MGSIKILLDNVVLEEQNSIIPPYGISLNTGNWVNIFNPLITTGLAIALFVFLMLFFVIKHKKNGLFTKQNIDERKKLKPKEITKMAVPKVLFLTLCFCVVVAPIHELIHAITGMFLGLNMDIGVSFESLSLLAFTQDDITKSQFLIFLVMPVLVTGIVPLLICYATFPKEKLSLKKAINLLLIEIFFCMCIISSVGDFIQIVNTLRVIPNGAVISKDYYYFPEDKEKYEEGNVK